MHAIDVTDVTKTYGDVTALDGLSLAVESGTTFGLLGTNGAGKSTLFKLLVGHVRPDSGAVAVAGRDVTTAGAAIRRSVGYLPERAGFPSALTGREVLAFHARIRGLAEPSARIDEALETVGLSDAADRRVGGYSNGMTRRLGLATALLSRPRILLLDEPTAGLDPRGVASFHSIVRQLDRDDDLTVVLSSHVLPEVERLCDAVAILHDGRLRASGSVAGLKRHVSDDVRVRVRLRDPGATEDALSAIAPREATVRSTDDAIAVDCSASAVPGVLADLAAAVPVEGYEVREPGLERVFERALSDPAEVSA
ncbi:ABC transporter ATP-binding protein [Halomarina halobia]|uniref:ABC transporter ATP-binding protein n=1 Tax=Halomarina halobia TaxID=3033386 RepID=A0ABD6A886_9EURY|nr:ABC transporter ATP-binding protein [Halomarina sp. PSR21]